MEFDKAAADMIPIWLGEINVQFSRVWEIRGQVLISDFKNKHIYKTS